MTASRVVILRNDTNHTLATTGMPIGRGIRVDDVACARDRSRWTVFEVGATVHSGDILVQGRVKGRLGDRFMSLDWRAMFEIADAQAAIVERVTVGSDGAIPAPLLGMVDVAGMTVQEAAERLRARYVDSELLVDPDLTAC